MADLKEASGSYAIRWLTGPLTGETRDVMSRLKIGRNPDSDIILPNGTPGASKNHCEVSASEGKICVTDLDSKYGTILNGSDRLPPHQPVMLKAGDQISLGPGCATFEIIQLNENDPQISGTGVAMPASEEKQTEEKPEKQLPPEEKIKPEKQPEKKPERQLEADEIMKPAPDSLGAGQPSTPRAPEKRIKAWMLPVILLAAVAVIAGVVLSSRSASSKGESETPENIPAVSAVEESQENEIPETEAATEPEADPELETEAAAVPEPTEEPEPEIVYVTKKKKAVVRETISGQQLPSSSFVITGRIFDLVRDYTYDDFGEVQETKEELVYPDAPDVFSGTTGNAEKADYTYEYDDAGNLIRVTTSANRTMNGISAGNRYTFENGMLIRDENIVLSNNRLVEDTVYTYGDNRQVVREEKAIYAYLITNQWFSSPIINNYEYDENGFCTRWQHIEGGQETDAAYTWNSDGNITALKILVNGEEADVYEISYENGVQSSVTRIKGGQTVVYDFAYDSEGKPTAIVYDVNGDHVETLFQYNEDGYLSEADWQQNGSSVGKTTYTYSAEEDGDIRCRTTGDLGPSIFGGMIEGVGFQTDHWSDWSYEYELKPVLIGVRYIETKTSCDYETISYQAEAEPKE